jgi:hypothetical protein
MTRTTIKIDVKTRDRLKKMGRKGDTYEYIINKLIKAYPYDKI